MRNLSDNELSQILNEWIWEMRRQEKIVELRNAFMSCDTTQQINDLINSNLGFLNANPILWKFPRDARKRITRIRKEKSKSWKTYQLN